MSNVSTPGSGFARQSRERYLILALLLILTLAAWAFLIWAPIPMQSAGSVGLTMGLSGSLFLLIWVVMMVAMMFPSAAPMILMFSRIYAGKRQQPQEGLTFVPTWIFVSAYLLIWVLFGVIAYIAALAVEALAQNWPWLADNAGRIGGALLIVGGLYQLSPLKEACLAKCRTPLGFILGSWRSGYGGSFRMGLEHGIYCLGCCWLLFVILFPLGIMNVAAMAVLALLIYAEKIFAAGRRIAQLAAVALVAYGVVVIAVPGTLPSMSASMPMPAEMSTPMPAMSAPMPTMAATMPSLSTAMPVMSTPMPEMPTAMPTK
jgi:predicted metal-binding membrane protein